MYIKIEFHTDHLKKESPLFISQYVNDIIKQGKEN
jgi:hypothetical protein